MSIFFIINLSVCLSVKSPLRIDVLVLVCFYRLKLSVAVSNIWLSFMTWILFKFPPLNANNKVSIKPFDTQWSCLPVAMHGTGTIILFLGFFSPNSKPCGEHVRIFKKNSIYNRFDTIYYHYQKSSPLTFI